MARFTSGPCFRPLPQEGLQFSLEHQECGGLRQSPVLAEQGAFQVAYAAGGGARRLRPRLRGPKPLQGGLAPGPGATE